MVHIKKYRDKKIRNKSNKSNSTQYSLENSIANKNTYTKSMRYTSQKLKEEAKEAKLLLYHTIHVKYCNKVHFDYLQLYAYSAVLVAVSLC